MVRMPAPPVLSSRALCPPRLVFESDRSRWVPSFRSRPRLELTSGPEVLGLVAERRNCRVRRGAHPEKKCARQSDGATGRETFRRLAAGLWLSLVALSDGRIRFDGAARTDAPRQAIEPQASHYHIFVPTHLCGQAVDEGRAGRCCRPFHRNRQQQRQRNNRYN